MDCREAEEYGYDAVFGADHLGIPAPFPLLVAAADATQRLRSAPWCSTCRSGIRPCWPGRS